MEKNAFAPLLRIHDEDGEFQTLLQANGFQVKTNETELLMAMSKWHRMAKGKEKIPVLDIKNINKFRDQHMAFLQEHFTAKQEAEMVKQQLAAKMRHEELMAKNPELAVVK